MPHPVADTADRPNVALGRQVVAELGPDVGDVDVDQVFVPVPVRSPDLLDQLAAGEGQLGSFDQGREQVELGTGQLDESLSQADLSGLRAIRAVSGCAVPRGSTLAARTSTFATDSGVHGTPRIVLQIVLTNSFAVPSQHAPR